MRGWFPGMIAAAVLLAAGAWADTGRSTGEPVPRYVSIDAETANLRAGPGKRYPVDWVFKRRRLPLRVVSEHGAWRRVAAWDGTRGWMHTALLSGRRTVQVTDGTVAQLRERPSPDATVIARLKPNVIGRFERCQAGWCRATFAELTGWVERTRLFGVPEKP